MLPVRFMNTDLCQFFSFFQNFLCLIPCLPIYDCFMVIPQIIGFHLLIRIGLDKRSVDGTVHGVWVGQVTGALDSDSPLIVCCTGRAPAPVLFFDTERHTAVLADAVVTTCLTTRADEAATDTFRRQLPHHTVRGDAVDAVCPLPRMVRAEVRINH